MVFTKFNLVHSLQVPKRSPTQEISKSLFWNSTVKIYLGGCVDEVDAFSPVISMLVVGVVDRLIGILETRHFFTDSNQIPTLVELWVMYVEISRVY